MLAGPVIQYAFHFLCHKMHLSSLLTLALAFSHGAIAIPKWDMVSEHGRVGKEVEIPPTHGTHSLQSHTNASAIEPGHLIIGNSCSRDIYVWFTWGTDYFQYYTLPSDKSLMMPFSELAKYESGTTLTYLLSIEKPPGADKHMTGYGYIKGSGKSGNSTFHLDSVTGQPSTDPSFYNPNITVPKPAIDVFGYYTTVVGNKTEFLICSARGQGGFSPSDWSATPLLNDSHPECRQRRSSQTYIDTPVHQPGVTSICSTENTILLAPCKYSGV
jgi:hypothetical protein